MRHGLEPELTNGPYRCDTRCLVVSGQERDRYLRRRRERFRQLYQPGDIPDRHLQRIVICDAGANMERGWLIERRIHRLLYAEGGRLTPRALLPSMGRVFHLRARDHPHLHDPSPAPARQERWTEIG